MVRVLFVYIYHNIHLFSLFLLFLPFSLYNFLFLLLLFASSCYVLSQSSAY